MGHMIEVRGLKKSYGSVEAVRGIDFTMEEGQLFAFLGPNGAGKSTSIHIITTFLKADEGEVRIDGLMLGKEDQKIRHLIGAVFQDGYLDGQLSIEENLKVRASLYGINARELRQAVERVCTLCDLNDIRKCKYAALSGGQRRRCDIARALLHQPKLLFLDEPTTGLDPKTRAMIWEVITRLQKEENMSVFLTTHYMEEAKDADEVVVLKQGLIQGKGTPAELKRHFAHNHLRLYTKSPKQLSQCLEEKGISYIQHVDVFEISLSTTMDALPILKELSGYFGDFEVILGTMDDAFLAIIQEEGLA